jgi:hypothetical protein
MACLSRVGAIISAARLLMNARDATRITDAEMVVFINEALDDLAILGYWKTTEAFNIAATTSAYDLSLSTLLTAKYVSMMNVYRTSDNMPLALVDSWDDYVQALLVCESGTPRYYHLAGPWLHLAPVPDTSETDGLTLSFYYRPVPDVDCSNVSPAVHTEPQTPEYYDKYFVYDILEKWCDHDQTSAYSQEKLARYSALKQQHLHRLLGSGNMGFDLRAG